MQDLLFDLDTIPVSDDQKHFTEAANFAMSHMYDPHVQVLNGGVRIIGFTTPEDKKAIDKVVRKVNSMASKNIEDDNFDKKN